MCPERAWRIRKPSRASARGANGCPEDRQVVVSLRQALQRKPVLYQRWLPYAVDLRRGSFIVVPEPRHSLLRDLRVFEAVSIEIEDGKLVTRHNIGSRLGLDPAPDISNGSFEDGCDRWMNLPFLVVPNDLERSCHRKLAGVAVIGNCLTHDVFVVGEYEVR